MPTTPPTGEPSPAPTTTARASHGGRHPDASALGRGQPRSDEQPRSNSNAGSERRAHGRPELCADGQPRAYEYAGSERGADNVNNDDQSQPERFANDHAGALHVFRAVGFTDGSTEYGRADAGPVCVPGALGRALISADDCRADSRALHVSFADCRADKGTNRISSAV